MFKKVKMEGQSNSFHFRHDFLLQMFHDEKDYFSNFLLVLRYFKPLGAICMGGKKREKVRIHVRQVDWNKTLMKGCSDGNKKPLHTNQAEREGEKTLSFFANFQMAI